MTAAASEPNIARVNVIDSAGASGAAGPRGVNGQDRMRSRIVSASPFSAAIISSVNMLAISVTT
jgi:hypothetical protein